MAKVEDCPGFETFGADVKAAREARRLARKTLAEMVGIEWRYLANIENQGAIPSLPVMIQLIKVCGLPVERYFNPEIMREESEQRQRVSHKLKLCPEEYLPIIEGAIDGALKMEQTAKQKPVFVLTTNVDQQFFRVFPQEQICAFQGDFSYCQCSQPCRDDIWENRELVKELTGRLVGVRLPEEAVPRCPDCGRVLVPWVRDDTFLEGTFWQDNLHRYHRFLRRWIMDQSDKKVLLLELGVGEMTPSIIKLPFWELTAKNENVFYACLNREASHRPEHLRGRSLYLQGDLVETLAALRQERSIAANIK